MFGTPNILASCRTGVKRRDTVERHDRARQHEFTQPSTGRIASRIIGNIVQAGPPKVSPDGRLVAFTVARVDEAKNKTFSQIWVAATDGSTPPRPLTAGEHDGEPAWSPDGRSLAFISRRGDRRRTRRRCTCCPSTVPARCARSPR